MRARLHRGFTLIELLVAMTIGILLLLLAMPGYMMWVSDSEILNGAESVANGLRTAQAAAISRNLNVQFVLGANGWTVEMADPPNAVLETASYQEGARNTTFAGVDAGALPATTVAFSALGQIVPNATNLVQVDIAKPSVTGTTPLRVVVARNLAVGGSFNGVKICDPRYNTVGNALYNLKDPKACPQ
jgi:prepilin-type N-terminal cleavage/methylation domain-containing protein